MKRDREETTWRNWLDRCGPALVLLARQYCGSRADAEDAVQDGFVRFWKSRDRATDATVYLFACVRSAALDLSRSRRRRERHEANVLPSEGMGDFFGGVEQQELQRAVERALETLPTEQREVLVMKIWSELTFAQIAEALDVKLATVASRYRYALERLQTALRQEASRD